MAKTTKMGPEGRELTEHERRMIQPAADQVANLQRALVAAQQNLMGLLALAEPEMLEEGSDLSFDAAEMRFRRGAKPPQASPKS